MLLDLSNELIYKIIDHIYSDDIINFSLTRKEVHDLAKDAVSLHRERKKTYERIVLDGCHRHQDPAHPLQVLKDLCMDGRIGTYVEMFTVECCTPPLDPCMYPEKEDKEDTRQFEFERIEDRIMTQRAMEAIQGYVDEYAVELGLWLWYLHGFRSDELCSKAARGDRFCSSPNWNVFVLLSSRTALRICSIQSSPWLSYTTCRIPRHESLSRNCVKFSW